MNYESKREESAALPFFGMPVGTVLSGIALDHWFTNQA